MNNQFIQLINWEEYPELCNTCAAFCVKYWQWHSGVEDFNGIDQRKSILEVYSRIQFGNFADEKLNLSPKYSNPLMICREYGGTYVYNMQDDFAASCLKTELEQAPEADVLEKDLTIDAGKYAMFIVEMGGGGYHYILIYCKNCDEYYYHDPLNPSPLPLKSGMPTLWEDIDNNNYRYTGAGIILP